MWTNSNSTGDIQLLAFWVGVWRESSDERRPFLLSGLPQQKAARLSWAAGAAGRWEVGICLPGFLSEESSCPGHSPRGPHCWTCPDGLPSLEAPVLERQGQSFTVAWATQAWWSDQARIQETGQKGPGPATVVYCWQHAGRLEGELQSHRPSRRLCVQCVCWGPGNPWGLREAS